MGVLHPEFAGVVQVFARDTRLPPESPLVYLNRGEAPILRPEARSGALVCPIEGCPSPSLTTRGGSRRDHFAHLRGGHARETLAHHTAKHLIARWLRPLLPAGASCVVDHDEVETGQRPDVLVTFDSGMQIAYEVQFAGLTPSEWLRRHRGYRDNGVRDVWLFGGSRYLQTPRVQLAAEGELRLTPVLSEVLKEQHPLLLISPFDELVGLGTGRHVESLLAAEAWSHPGGEYMPTWHRLSEIRQAWGMPVVPGWTELRDRTASRRRANELRDRQRRAWLAQIEERWSKVRASLLEAAQPIAAVADLIEQDSGPDWIVRALAMLGAHWRWIVLDSLPEKVGATTRREDLVASLMAALPDAASPEAEREVRRHALAAVDELLGTLRRAGWVYFDARDAGGEVLVLATLASPPCSGQAAAVKAGRWRLEKTSLRLLSADSESVVLNLTPLPQLLPRRVRPKTELVKMGSSRFRLRPSVQWQVRAAARASVDVGIDNFVNGIAVEKERQRNAPHETK